MSMKPRLVTISDPAPAPRGEARRELRSQCGVTDRNLDEICKVTPTVLLAHGELPDLDPHDEKPLSRLGVCREPKYDIVVCEL